MGRAFTQADLLERERPQRSHSVHSLLLRFVDAGLPNCGPTPLCCLCHAVQCLGGLQHWHSCFGGDVMRMPLRRWLHHASHRRPCVLPHVRTWVSLSRSLTDSLSHCLTVSSPASLVLRGNERCRRLTRVPCPCVSYFTPVTRPTRPPILAQDQLSITYYY